MVKRVHLGLLTVVIACAWHDSTLSMLGKQSNIRFFDPNYRNAGTAALAKMMPNQAKAAQQRQWAALKQQRVALEEGLKNSMSKGDVGSVVDLVTRYSFLKTPEVQQWLDHHKARDLAKQNQAKLAKDYFGKWRDAAAARKAKEAAAIAAGHMDDDGGAGHAGAEDEDTLSMPGVPDDEEVATKEESLAKQNQAKLAKDYFSKWKDAAAARKAKEAAAIAAGHMGDDDEGAVASHVGEEDEDTLSMPGGLDDEEVATEEELDSPKSFSSEDAKSNFEFVDTRENNDFRTLLRAINDNNVRVVIDLIKKHLQDDDFFDRAVYKAIAKNNLNVVDAIERNFSSVLREKLSDETYSELQEYLIEKRSDTYEPPVVGTGDPKVLEGYIENENYQMIYNELAYDKALIGYAISFVINSDIPTVANFIKQEFGNQMSLQQQKALDRFLKESLMKSRKEFEIKSLLARIGMKADFFEGKTKQEALDELKMHYNEHYLKLPIKERSEELKDAYTQLMAYVNKDFKPFSKVTKIVKLRDALRLASMLPVTSSHKRADSSGSYLPSSGSSSRTPSPVSVDVRDALRLAGMLRP